MANLNVQLICNLTTLNLHVLPSFEALVGVDIFDAMDVDGEGTSLHFSVGAPDSTCIHMFLLINLNVYFLGEGKRDAALRSKSASIQ